MSQGTEKEWTYKDIVCQIQGKVDQEESQNGSREPIG